MPRLRCRLLVRRSGRIIGGLSLPVRRVVVLAWVAWIAGIAMILMASPIWLLTPGPSSAVIGVRWVGPAVFAQRERPFPSLPLTLVHLAIPFHRVSFIVAHRLHPRPLGVIFHRVRGRSHRIVPSSVHVVGRGRPAMVGRPRGRRARERLRLAARPRWDAMSGHPRVAALLMLWRSSVILRRPISLHLWSIVASLR